MGQTITFQRPDTRTCTGYYVEPDTDPKIAPGVVVLPEWWGLNDQIKDEAGKLADEGYRVVVPDLYFGKVAVDAAEAESLMTHLDFGDAAQQTIRGALQQLKHQSSKVAVMGFCMGGVLTMLAAIHVPEADVAVCWYGIPAEEAGDPRTIKIPVQGHFAQHDSFCPPAKVDTLEVSLQKGHVDYEFYRYDAHHAFGNQDRDIYNPEATKLAWKRSLTFLSTHLR